QPGPAASNRNRCKAKGKKMPADIFDLRTVFYARDKFAAERYPFAPALPPIPQALAKLGPRPDPRTARAKLVPLAFLCDLAPLSRRSSRRNRQAPPPSSRSTN